MQTSRLRIVVDVIYCCSSEEATFELMLSPSNNDGPRYGPTSEDVEYLVIRNAQT